MEDICSLVDMAAFKKMNVVFDVGNGMVGLVLPKLLERLPIVADVLYGDIDMTFPNHEANPLKDETLIALKNAVAEKQADLGVAFDGDGDRVRFITPKGFAIPGDIMAALFAQNILQNSRSGTSGDSPLSVVVYTVNSSRIVREVIEQAGGDAIESRVGHALIKKVMRARDALFGGEVSGHFYWRDYYYAESALLATLRMLAILSASGKTLDELVRPLLRYASSGEINITVPDKDKALDAVAAHYQDAKEIKYVDGISVAYEDFWFNVRPSNTESLLRITMEAKEKSVLDARLDELLQLVRQ